MAVVICPKCNPPSIKQPSGWTWVKKRYVPRKGKPLTVMARVECPDCEGLGIISDDGQPPQ